MSAKAKLMEKDATKDVYINDFFSKETLKLLNYAKTLKSVGFRRVYAVSGRVMVKKSELSKPKIIRSAEEVDSFLLEGATRRRKSMVTADDSDAEHNTQYLST